MPKRILLVVQFALLPLLAASPDSRAQGGKPSQALRQVAQQEQKLLETLQRDAERLRERSSSIAPGAPGAPGASVPVFAPDPPDPPDPDEVDEALIKFAAERAAGFKIGDWKGEELYALATLYQWAEQFAPAGEAFRAYLKGDSKSGSKTGIAANARAGLMRALIETEQLDEAEKSLEGAEWDITDNLAALTARTGLYKDLAVALRDRGLYDKVATLADKGYKLADSLVVSGGLPPGLLETVEINQIILAATAVASYERVGRKREADDLNKMALDFDFNRRPELRPVYESELAVARLIGTPAPELEVSRWIEGNRGAPKSLSELRGNVVLLDFWAMWSQPSLIAFPRLRGFQSKYAGKGFEIIGVTKFYGRSDSELSLSREQEFKSLQNYKTRHRLTYPFAVGKMDDVTNEERYGVAGVPTMILIDRRGVVRSVKRGAGEYRKLEKQIERSINEK